VLIEAGRAAGAHVEAVFNFRGGLRPRAWGADLAAARRVIHRWRPEIVHVNGSQDHWTFGALMRGRSGYPPLVRTRHNTNRVSASPPNLLLNSRWTDRQITVCEAVRRRLAERPGFDPSRMTAIHNGVDAQAFAPDREARARTRGEFGFGDEDIVCGVVARLTPAKGHVHLLEALASLGRELPALRLLVLGEGVLRGELEQRVQAMGWAERTVFAGYREDMAACVQAIDIGVQPSVDTDTSSFSMKELMAAEKPVVASDYGGLPEIADNGAEGLVVPAGSAEPLARAVRTLAEDPPLRARMGKAGRERVLRDFTVETFGRRTINVYEEALERHEHPAHR
jgi:glycosyltransferase involved in cell wall biosynthesis